jgi:colicin import membrane protein
MIKKTVHNREKAAKSSLSSKSSLYGADQVVSAVSAQNPLLKAFSGHNRKYLVASVIFHLVVMCAFFVNWESKEVVEPVKLPNSIQARVLSADELKQLQAKKRAKLKKIADKKHQEQTKKEARKQEQIKQQKIKKDKEKKRLKAAEVKRKKALAIKKAEKLKKQKRDAKKKLEKQRMDDEKLKANEQLKKEKLLALEQQQKVDAKEKKEREKNLLNKLKSIENQKKAQALIDAQNLRALELLTQQKAAQAFELTEIERFMALIRSRIEARWRIPPKSRGLSLLLRLRLLPNGELELVKVLKSSGNTSFDRSAEHAARSVRHYPVPTDNGIFERNFRQFSMHFSFDPEI